jgi:hypothetical protein
MTTNTTTIDPEITQALMCGRELVHTPRSKDLGQILELQIRGRTNKEIAYTLNLTQQRVDNTLRSFRKDYFTALSVKGLIPVGTQNVSEILKGINKPFYDLLSRSDQPLTDSEMLYCAYFISTGNSIDALVKAELDAGLIKGTEGGTGEIYSKNCLLRSEALKRKRNIQEEIRRLQHERLNINEINKDHLVALHMEMIDQLKDEGAPKNRSLIVKLLDQVNKLTGSYTAVIKTGEISADDVLDGMMAIMQEEKPEELQNEEITSV